LSTHLTIEKPQLEELGNIDQRYSILNKKLKVLFIIFFLID